MANTRADYRDKVLSCKVTLMGSTRAGKSSLARAFTGKPFSYEYDPTIVLGPTYVKKIHSKEAIKLFLRDSHGKKDDPLNVQNILCKGASLILIVFDVNDSRSFDEIDFWVDKARKIEPNTVIALVGNKIESGNTRVVSMAQLEVKANELNVDKNLCFEVDAQYNLNIESMFHSLVKKIELEPGSFSRLKVENKYSSNENITSTQKKNTNNFFRKHTSKIVFSVTAALLASLFIALAVVAWPAIITVPFIAAAGTAIASLNIGLSVAAATTAIAITGISVTGLGMTALGSYLLSKLTALLNKKGLTNEKQLNIEDSFQEKYQSSGLGNTLAINKQLNIDVSVQVSSGRLESTVLLEDKNAQENLAVGISQTNTSQPSPSAQK